MSDPVIRVENLGKHYRLRHQQPERYTALRDVIAHRTQSFLQRLNPLSSFKPQSANRNEEEFWALRDVSFEVNAGDRIGIIGRNGAGKSTLLKILSRITEPSTGSIRIKGRVASLLEVGTGFHPELTGRENIFLNGAILGMSRTEIRRKFDEIVAFAEVEKFLDTPVKRYSSGMYVRLAFAVAAHLEPEILIIDEVLAVGDAAFQKKCLGKMEDIAENEGRTILFVSHNVAAIKKLCNYGFFLQNGDLLFQGVVDKSIEFYQENIHSDASFGNNQNIQINDVYPKKINDFFEIKNINLVDQNGSEIKTITTGKSLQIQIDYLSQEKVIYPSFILACKTATDIKLFELHSSPTISGHMPDIEKGHGSITLIIPYLPLLGGTYYFDLSLAQVAVKRYFTIERLIKLLIEPSDVYSTGYLFDQKNGFIEIPHKWEYS
ncbi:ABC transporter ATP-binding protein [Leptolyngbya sp. FACHB-16]|uniref:ABC transporter ATP-binding protein n=1 Tax=unclassified Leptolyngbya TaxID=2650499 RepID=UPI001684D392|nr:ABC transporter ATP-binding protein [Leptolyngbya sp. FACHB-16]MBD2156176.1 ABC transporter ATP-binding protein [Leptolyngbya sp. FACHB-16]